MLPLIIRLWLAGLITPILAQSTTSPAAPRVTNDYLGGSSYLGCYIDTSNRALSGPMTELSTNTIETCHKYCVGQGFALFGVQDSSQCFCGNNITSGGHDLTDESQCNYACSGNSTETCGGYWRMNVFKLIATSSSSIHAISSSSSSSPSSTAQGSAVPSVTKDSLGASYLGCYTDTSDRALASKMTDLGTNSIENCHTYCIDQGYSLFGVEYGSQCFCGNEITPGHTNATQSDCNYSCSGKKDELCGGYWRIGIYQLRASTSSATPSASAKSSALISSTPAISSVTSLPISSVVISSAGPSATIDSLGGSYMGCYTDTSDRALPKDMTETNDNSIENCHNHCAGQGYGMFGVEYGSQCFCGNNITAGHNPAGQSDCNYACTGAKAQICGGYWRIGIYSLQGSSSASSALSSKPISTESSSIQGSSTAASSGAISSSAVTIASNSVASSGGTALSSSVAPSVTTDPMGGKYEGCRQDTADRVLSGPMTEGNAITIEGCHSWCLSQGFSMFGLEYSTQCFCGNEISHPEAHPPAYQQSECNWPCSGNSTEECGGYWRIGIYSIPSDSSSSGTASVPPWTASSTPSLPTQTGRPNPAEHTKSSKSSSVLISSTHSGVSPSQSSSLISHMSSASVGSTTHGHQHSHISDHIKAKSSTSSIAPIASTHTSTKLSSSNKLSSQMSSHTSNSRSVSTSGKPSTSTHASHSGSSSSSRKPSTSIHTSHSGSSSSSSSGSKTPTSSHPKTTTSPTNVCQRYIAARDKVTKQVALLKSEKKPISDGITGQWSALTDSTAQQNCQLAEIKKVQQNGLPLGAFMVWYKGVFEQIGASSGVSC